MGMLYTLVQRIGRPRAARMMMLATTASGAEAVTTGLADELAEPGGALEHAMKIARQYEAVAPMRSEEHTSELQSLMRISYAVFCLKKKNTTNKTQELSDALN